MKEIVERLLQLKSDVEVVEGLADKMGIPVETISGIYCIKSNIDELAGAILLHGFSVGSLTMNQPEEEQP